MAGPKNSKTGEDSSPPSVQNSSPLDVPEVNPYTLHFEFVRLEAYCASEASFYGLLGKAVSVLSIVSGTSAVATILAQSYIASGILALLSVTLSSINHVVKFNDKYQFYNRLRSKYSKWRDELERNHQNDIEWINRAYHAMRKLEDDYPYKVRWAVEALAWNDAYYQTRPLEAVKYSELLEVWFCEQLVMHIFSFTREHFVSRQHNNWLKKNRIWIGASLIVMAFIIGSLPFIFWSRLPSTGFIFGVLPLALLISFLLFDAGYHKLKGALAEINVDPPPASNHKPSLS